LATATDLTRRCAWLGLLAGAVNGCSGATAPSPGMFQARLAGARVAVFSGSAIGEVSYTEEFPELQFAIRMHASRGDTLQSIGIRCTGNQPPSAGTHGIDLAGQDCVASYSRVLLNAQPGPRLLESADAVTGTLRIEPSADGQTAGTFSFQGTMEVDGESAGSVTASGSFSADVI
jgi:hypothetical protein